MTAASPSQLAW